MAKLSVLRNLDAIYRTEGKFRRCVRAHERRARRSFRFPSQLTSQCNFSQVVQILHEERVFCRAAPLGTPENNRRLHIVQKIRKNLTTLHNLPNSIHKLQIKSYRENKKSDLWLMNLPFTLTVKNTTQTQSSTNWNLTLNPQIHSF